jgi:hypothetical protein
MALFLAVDSAAALKAAKGSKASDLLLGDLALQAGASTDHFRRVPHLCNRAITKSASTAAPRSACPQV